MTNAKSARLNQRLSDRDDLLVRQAAQLLGCSVTEFLTGSAVARAHEVVADLRHFSVDDEVWELFVDALDAPAEPDPDLVRLFERPRRVER